MGECVFVVVVVVVVVVTHFLRAPCFKTGYAGSAGFAGMTVSDQIRNFSQRVLTKCLPFGQFDIGDLEGPI